MWGYRARDVARLLGLPEAEIRRYAREGFVSARRGPRGAWRFSFQDLVLLRTAAELKRARVPAARVRRSLRRLREQLPAGRSLAGVQIAADGSQVVVRDGGAAWQPESGQILIDFRVSDVARQVAPLLSEAGRGSRQGGPAHGAEEFYQWGCDLEPGAPAQALAAYRRALELEPGHAGANLNLGRLLHERGDVAGAERHYRRAMAAAGPSALAAFNLGIALEDLGRADEAIEAYRSAVLLDPGLADAHFNRARLLEARGRKAEALGHLSAYRRLERATRG
jgi:tetratricopeptide (TPR) repeat protein